MTDFACPQLYDRKKEKITGTAIYQYQKILKCFQDYCFFKIQVMSFLNTFAKEVVKNAK